MPLGFTNVHREDLAQAGLGSGRHGFQLQPEGILPSRASVKVWRSIDGVALPLQATRGDQAR